jgi:hypothetical protein
MDVSLSRLGVIEQLPNCTDDPRFTCPILPYQDVEAIMQLNGEACIETFKTINFQDAEIHSSPFL